MTMSLSRLQFLLAQSPVFQGRVQLILLNVASTVLSETGVGSSHTARANYARLILNNPAHQAAQAAAFVAQGTNVVAFGITMEDDGVHAAIADVDLFAQIAAQWNQLAGIDTGN